VQSGIVRRFTARAAGSPGLPQGNPEEPRGS
jgi:hypothetical protein